MVSARSFDGLDLALIYPLLQGGVADAQYLAGVAHRVKLRLHFAFHIRFLLRSDGCTMTVFQSGASSEPSSGVAGALCSSVHVPDCTTFPCSSTIACCGHKRFSTSA